MKTITWKKIAFGTVAMAVLAFVIFRVIPSKGTQGPTEYINPAFAEYISSYTAGVINSRSSIRIVLTEDVVEESEVGNEANAKLFDFNPAVKGKAIWLNRQTIEFKPDTRFVSGQRHTVSFHLSRLMDVPDNLKLFSYSFQIIPQNFEFTVSNIKPYVKTDLKRQKIEGILFTSDFAEGAAVEKMIV
ncbi:MAG: hypothetical protein OEU76_07850, partial [Cyclobacteriaceae bacterium]|nr:hypothetical protein [Cyclobacteriaceae bacterium]